MKIRKKKMRGGGGQDGCERRIKVFVKTQKKLGGGRVGGGGGGGGQDRCEQIIEVFVKIQKNIYIFFFFFFFFLGGGGVR